MIPLHQHFGRSGPAGCWHSFSWRDTIALSIVLLRRETWRRDTPTESARADTVRLGTGTDDAPVREHPADELAYIAESLAAYQGEGPAKRRLPMRPQPLKRWSDPTKNVKDAALWAWGERGGRPRSSSSSDSLIQAAANLR